MYIYIFLSFLFTFFFFLTFFILPSSFLPLSSRDLFFLTRAFSQESSSSLFHFLSLPLSGIRFNPSIRFPNRSFFFLLSFLYQESSFLYQSQGDYFPSIFPNLTSLVFFSIDSTFRMISQTPPLRLSFLLYRFEFKEFHSQFFLSIPPGTDSIFDPSPPPSCLEYRPWLHFPSLSFRPWEFSLRASSLFELCSATFCKLYFYAVCNFTRN